MACERWNASHLTTASYSPWQNQVERRNQSIKDKLRIQLLDKPHKRWDQDIPKILYSLRNSVNHATGRTPAEIYFHQRLRHPKEHSCSDSTSNESNGTSPTLFSHHRQAIENQRKYVRKYENKKTAPPLHKLDSIIYIRNHELSQASEGFIAALAPKWIGPFQIIHVYPSGVYKCVSLNNPQDIRKVSYRDTQFRYYASQSRSAPSYYYNRRNRKQTTPEPRTNDASQGSAYLRFSSTNSNNLLESLDLNNDFLPSDWRYDNRTITSKPSSSQSPVIEQRPKRKRKPNPKYLSDLWNN